jgi:hypothetical protein
MVKEKRMIPQKFVRPIKPYKKKVKTKVIRVEGYRQTYVVPRGPKRTLKTDRLTNKSQTMWLMDKQGRFVGRANIKGDTTATGVSKYGYDQTTTLRDAKRYKRVWGRTSPRRDRVVRR